MIVKGGWLKKNNLVGVVDEVYTNKGTYLVYKITNEGEKHLSNKDRPS